MQEILDKYCKFLPVPIKFDTTTQEEEDGVDEEGKPKYKSVEVDNIINDTNPIWTKAPADLKDEDYLNFYKQLYHAQFRSLKQCHVAEFVRIQSMNTKH